MMMNFVDFCSCLALAMSPSSPSASLCFISADCSPDFPRSTIFSRWFPGDSSIAPLTSHQFAFYTPRLLQFRPTELCISLKLVLGQIALFLLMGLRNLLIFIGLVLSPVKTNDFALFVGTPTGSTLIVSGLCLSRFSIYFRATPSPLSLGLVSPGRKISPVTIVSAISPTSLFPQVCSTSHIDSPPLDFDRIIVEYVALVLWNSDLASSSPLPSLLPIVSFDCDCESPCGPFIAIVRLIAAVCRLVSDFTVIVLAPKCNALIRGCEAFILATVYWKILSIRCPLPQYEDVTSQDFYEVVGWELLRSSHNDSDILLDWTTFIIFVSTQDYPLKLVNPMVSLTHPALLAFAFNWFMVAVRTGPSELHGTNWCGKEVMDGFLFVSSTSMRFVAFALAVSLVVKSALVCASFTDMRSPDVISDSEGVLSLLNSKDGSISRLIVVMYGFIGFFYVYRLANVAAFILALIALLSSLLKHLLHDWSLSYLKKKKSV